MRTRVLASFAALVLLCAGCDDEDVSLSTVPRLDTNPEEVVLWKAKEGEALPNKRVTFRNSRGGSLTKPELSVSYETPITDWLRFADDPPVQSEQDADFLENFYTRLNIVEDTAMQEFYTPDRSPFRATMTVDSDGADNSPVEVPITLNIVDDSPLLWVNPTRMKFRTSEGYNPPEAKIQVRNYGDKPMQLQMVESCDWLTIDYSNTAMLAPSEEPLEIGLQINVTGSDPISDDDDLERGNYHTTIIAAGVDTPNSPIEISVSLEVYLGIPKLELNPKEIIFPAVSRGTAPPPETIYVRNVGDPGSVMPWSYSATVEWLQLTPASGEVRAGDEEEVTVNVWTYRPEHWRDPPDAFVDADGMPRDPPYPEVRSRHSAVWTGADMVIWGGTSGGFVQQGWSYNVAADVWRQLPTEDQPPLRYEHTAVHTGPDMIVWGGITATGATNLGGFFDLSAFSWGEETDHTSAPTARFGHSAVYTGQEMIIWGGNANGLLQDGKRFNPAGNTSAEGKGAWSPGDMRLNGYQPSPREQHTAVYAVDARDLHHMIVYGGLSGGAILGDGALYDVETDDWEAGGIGTSGVGYPGFIEGHSAVWNGADMIVWGGHIPGFLVASGGYYDPHTNDWPRATAFDMYTPSARYQHTAVWATNRMMVWGGESAFYHNDGGSLFLEIQLEEGQYTVPVTFNAPTALDSPQKVNLTVEVTP